MARRPQRGGRPPSVERLCSEQTGGDGLQNHERLDSADGPGDEGSVYVKNAAGKAGPEDSRECVARPGVGAHGHWRPAMRCGLAEVTAGSFAGVICSIDLPPTWMKLNSRAASSAFTASFTRERAAKFPKKVSSSAGSAAITQSRYFESSAESACCTDRPTPSLTASGAQR